MKEESGMQNEVLTEKEREERLYKKILDEAVRRGYVTLTKESERNGKVSKNEANSI